MICVFGGTLVDGLRSKGQNVHWITDDDSTVATANAKADAADLMGAVLHKYPNEWPELGLGIASQFDDDRCGRIWSRFPTSPRGRFPKR